MNSLVITEKEKYPDSHPCCSPCGSSGKGKDKVRKYAPTVELTASQIAAFGLDGAKLEEKGTATVSFVVRSVRAGESYGDEISTKKSVPRVTIQLLAAEPSDAEAVEDESDDGADEKAAEPAAEVEAPAKDSGEKVSPTEAFGDDEE